MKKEKNSFDKTVEMFPEADAIFLSRFDKENHAVMGEPFSTKTNQVWSMSMVSSIEEAVDCKYPKVWRDDDEELNNYFESLPQK